MINNKDMSAKIFGIGLPKTGTSSLHAALEILGYRSVHYPVTMAEIDSHEAANDISVACRFEELDQLYPGSKFILTVRELNKWLQSCYQHFGQKVNPNELSPLLREFLLAHRLKAFDTKIYDPILFEQAYQTHVRHVQNYFAHRPQDLLIINISGGQGWERLCPFVGHPILDKPFPCENFGCESLAMMFQEMTVKLEQNLGNWLK